MANYPQERAQDSVCQSHTGHMTGLWFLLTRPLRLNSNEWMNYNMIPVTCFGPIIGPSSGWPLNSWSLQTKALWIVHYTCSK